VGITARNPPGGEGRKKHSETLERRILIDHKKEGLINSTAWRKKGKKPGVNHSENKFRQFMEGKRGRGPGGQPAIYRRGVQKRTNVLSQIIEWEDKTAEITRTIALQNRGKN